MIRLNCILSIASFFLGELTVTLNDSRANDYGKVYICFNNDVKSTIISLNAILCLCLFCKISPRLLVFLSLLMLSLCRKFLANLVCVLPSAVCWWKLLKWKSCVVLGDLVRYIYCWSNFLFQIILCSRRVLYIIMSICIMVHYLLNKVVFQTTLYSQALEWLKGVRFLMSEQWSPFYN